MQLRNLGAVNSLLTGPCRTFTNTSSEFRSLHGTEPRDFPWSPGPLVPCSRTTALWAHHVPTTTPAGVVLLRLLQKSVPTTFLPELPRGALPASLLPPLGAQATTCQLKGTGCPHTELPHSASGQVSTAGEDPGPCPPGSEALRRSVLGPAP